MTTTSTLNTYFANNGSCPDSQERRHAGLSPESHCEITPGLMTLMRLNCLALKARRVSAAHLHWEPSVPI
jgi:hypothetical protein